MPASNIRVAVAALMKTLSQENGPYGITANTVATGPFESELLRNYRDSGTGVKTKEWYRKMLPVGPASTGETIRIDGGYTKSLF